MRLKLTLKAVDTEKIALNYNHSLSSAIYSLLHLGSPEFSEFLHNIGFQSNNKIYKLFTFALLFERNTTTVSGEYLNLNSPLAYLYISSPLIEDFIRNFVFGTFEKKRLEIYSDYSLAKFSILQAEFVPPPQYSERMPFRMMAPLVLSTVKEYSGNTSQYYFRYDDDIQEVNRVFEKNLVNKYEAVTNVTYAGRGLTLKWDAGYVRDALKRKKRLSKKVSIYKERNNPIDVIGVFCPFSVNGDINLIRIGYECGFGEKNSMGFGMVQIQ